MLNRVPSREEGQGLVEYALILVLVAIVVIAVLLQLGPEIRRTFCTITSYLQQGDVVLCSGGAGGGQIITDVEPVYSPGGFGTPSSLSVTVTVSQGTTVTINGDGGVTGSHTFGAAGAYTFGPFNNPPASGSVTATDSSGGQAVAAYW